ncbi:hypothetical protein AVEN_120680-1 [Araneus ventricosus]|uniref:Uncharacterized protein n=1 Tax=Araneus ventricosus TaxID=182803 RepID=A0A4Y2LYE8_ARAVE|nr:hypothetical protein AVEN_120680-1 [Araneus ventricosus]
MDSSAPFPLFSSLRMVGDMNYRPSISPLRLPLNTTRPATFSTLSEQQPAKIRPTGMEVAWPVTAGLGVRVLKNTWRELEYRFDILRAAKFEIH